MMYLIFDFDGTITTEDSISHLARAALQHHQSRSGPDLQTQWDTAVREYMQDRQRYKTSFQERRRDESPNPLETELEYLGGMKEVEEASLARIKASGLFKGIGPSKLRTMGQEARQQGRLKIRNGFKEMMQLAEDKGWKVGIISINWSTAWIRGVLSDYAFNAIFANEIGESGQILGPGFHGAPLTTAVDKSKALKQMLGESHDRAIYFGDSDTDIACLLKGGILITGGLGTDSNVLQSLKAVGIDILRVGDSDGHGGGGIAWAGDFQEVMASGILNKLYETSSESTLFRECAKS